MWKVMKKTKNGVEKCVKKEIPVLRHARELAIAKETESICKGEKAEFFPKWYEEKDE